MISPTTGKPVTVTLNADSYNSRFFNIDIYSKIFINKNMLPKQKVKNKETIYRFLKKKYKPYKKVSEVKRSEGETTITITGKTYN